MAEPDDDCIDLEGDAAVVPGWWSAAPSLMLTVQCGGLNHTMRWAHGEVELIDHPEIDAELALVALGGPEPACLTHYRLWDDAVSDGGFVGEWVDETRLSQAWFSWLAMALERMRTEGFHEFLRGLPPKRAQRMGEFLHYFPRSWIDRAAATVSHRIVDGTGVTCEHAAGLLAGATTHRLRKAFVDAVGGRHLAVGTAALVPLSLSVGATPSAVGALTGPARGVEIQVPNDWLHKVWAAGAAVIGGRLVLQLQISADPSTDGAIVGEATTVRWDESATPVLERQAVCFAAGRWSVVARYLG